MITVINGDARHLPLLDESIHLVVTSPPYNCGINYQSHGDNMDKEKHLKMLNDAWDECYRVLVPGGRLCVNAATGVNRSPYFPLASYITMGLEVKFNLLGTIVWHKNTKAYPTSWGSWRSASSPCLRDNCESIIVGHKPGKFEIPKFDTPDGYSPFLDADTFLELTRDLWTIPPTTPGRSKHPAAFPKELPARLIKLFAFPGATVLDPFAGSGTTGHAAKDLELNAILVDTDNSYCELMQANLLKQPDLFRKMAS